MGIEFPIILGAIALIYLLVGYIVPQLSLYLKKIIVWKTRKQWIREGRTIQWGPEGIICYGLLPRPFYVRQAFGVIGIVDHRLIFKSHVKSWNIDTPLDQISGLALCKILVRDYRGKSEQAALEIHTEYGGLWRVYTLTRFFQLVSEIRSLGVSERHTIQQIIDMRAQFLWQDVYGTWHDHGVGDLYLAPDRIVFHWQSLIHFAEIRRIEIVEHSGLPFARDMVRIEYQSPENCLYTVGFVMHGAESWAEALSNHTNIPVKSHVGRKKKED
jgi:hypothetical protein